jgi:hypothetical protein
MGRIGSTGVLTPQFIPRGIGGSLGDRFVDLGIISAVAWIRKNGGDLGEELLNEARRIALTSKRDSQRKAMINSLWDRIPELGMLKQEQQAKQLPPAVTINVTLGSVTEPSTTALPPIASIQLSRHTDDE